MTTVVDDLDDLPGLVGSTLGPSPWLEVTQERCVAQPIFRFLR